MNPSSTEVTFRPLSTLSKETCAKRPKPASTFTDMGFSFSSRSSGSHTATSGVLDTRSSHCTTIQKRRIDGVAKYGSYGIYSAGPKPPVWVLTSETVGNKPVKVFFRVSDIETVDAGDLPFTDTQLNNAGLWGVYVGTGECGIGRQACRQKCYISGTAGCVVDDSSRASTKCTSCAPCKCATSVSLTGKGTKRSGGCSFQYEHACDWEGIHLVRLDNNLSAGVLQQLAEFISGVNTGWRSAEIDPQIVDPVDFNPGNILGMMQWNKNIDGSKLANVLNANSGCPSVRIPASHAAAAALAIKGTVTIGPEYNNRTTFMQTRLGVAVNFGLTTDQYYLAVVTMYVPVMTGVSTLSAPDAGNRLCCLFTDTTVDNSANPLCLPVLSYVSMVYESLTTYPDIQADNVVLSMADEARFVMAYQAAVTGTSTGTSRTMYLGDQEFTITPYSILGIPGLVIEPVGSSMDGVTVAVRSQAALPLTSEQVGLWGDIHIKLDRMDNTNLFAEFALFRRTGLSLYTLPTNPILSGSELFATTPVVNTSPAATYEADLWDSDSNPTFAYRSPPVKQSSTVSSPLGFGFSQFVMSSAAVAVSGLETVSFRIKFVDSGDMSWTDETWEFRVNPISEFVSSTLSFAFNRVLPTVEEETIVQNRQTSSIHLASGTNDRHFQVLMTIYDGDWVLQLIPCNSDNCDAAGYLV